MRETRIRRLALALLEATADADPGVREQLRDSLGALGEAEPQEILECSMEFLRQHDRLPFPFRVVILEAVATLLRHRVAEVGNCTAAALIALASQELTKSKEPIPEWQEAAGAVLVELGKNFLSKVMEEMLGKFQPGILPHPGVLRTFGNLATANVFGMVPFLNSILGTLLPMLGTARADSMKISCCYALQRFSESIQEYLAGREQAPDPTIRRDAFAHELGAAFQLLFHSWIHSRDAKLRVAVLEALGPLSSLIPEEKLEEEIPKILPGILGLYRKNPEPLPISKSLCQILESSVGIGSRSLESQLESLLAALLAQICSPADPKLPTSAKNQTELLRCFSVLARSHPERVVNFLLPKFESGSEKIRVGALLLLRHLINSAPSQLETKKSLIISSLKAPMQDGNNKVRRALVQLIGSLAPRGFLEQPGAEALLEFLIHQCALPSQGPSGIPEENPEDPTSDDVRSVSGSTLILLSSTVDRMSHVLWPFLLQFLLPPQLSPALPPLCRSLALLAAKIREKPLENPKDSGNFPSPQALTVRLLVVSSQPFLGCDRGGAALRLLRELRIHPGLEKFWEKEIPALLEHLEGHSEDSLNQEEWEERLLQFLRESLSSIPEKSWICPLVSESFRQLRASDGSREEKNFLYKSLGTALEFCPSKELVGKQLQEILENARYQDQEERESLALCFGICARNHLEETLEKLEEFEKSEVFRKSLGLFSIFKERSEVEQERLRSALVLCHGRVAEAAPPELLRSHLESQILQILLRHGHTKVLGIKVETKDPALKLSLARSISMIGRALTRGDPGKNPGKNSGKNSGNSGKKPGNGAGGSVSITRKAELVALMVEFLKAEAPDSLRSRLRQRALDTCTHLLPLDPPLGDPERRELLEAALGSVLALPPPESGKNREQPPEQDFLGDALGALRELLRGLLRTRLSPHGLQELFERLEPWIRSPRAPERQRALGLSRDLLETFLENLHVSSVTPFYNLSRLLALLAPRCSDGIPKIRADSVDSVRALLRIQLRYQGFSRDHRDELVEGLESLKEGLENPDFSVLFRTCSTLGSVIGKRIPPEQLLSLILALLEFWEDPDGNCARAASVLCNSLLRERGTILQEKVPDLLGALHSQLQRLQEEQLCRALQQSLLILALQHPRSVVGCLLGRALPFDSSTRCLWRALGSEPSLSPAVLELLVERLEREIPFKENKSLLPGGGRQRLATVPALAATSALAEVLAVPEASAALPELFPKLFRSLLMRLGCSVGLQIPKFLQGPEKRSLQPCSCAVSALRSLLSRAGLEAVVGDVGGAGGWELMEIPERHHDGIALLAGAMSRLCGPRLPPIVRSLVPELGSAFESHRATGAAFLAQLLVHNVVNDLALLEPLLDALTALEKDSSLLVRILALRGLGNAASGSPEKIRRHGPQLLASMVQAMDDKDDPENRLALEAMAGLSKILDRLDERHVQSLLLHVAIRIRPFFDSEHPDLRRSSIVLFGNLSRFSRSDSEVFSEQILNGLVTLLLHLQDPEPGVVKACKFALRMSGASVGCEELREMFGNHLREERGLHYGEFINHVCKILMRSHPALLGRLVSTNLFYFKSPWQELRAAAAMSIGFLVLHVDEEQGQQLDLDQLISALKLLLKDPVPTVRVKAAETLGRLVRLL